MNADFEIFVQRIPLLVLSNTDIIIICLHTVAIICILFAKFIGPLNDILLYGKNLKNSKKLPTKNQSVLNKFIDVLVKLTVPKSFFLHFYILYASATVLSILTLNYLPGCLNRYANDSIFNILLKRSSTKILTTEEFKNLEIILVLTVIQSLRRLLESIYVTKFSSTSKMNISHYIVGLLFYFLISSTTFLSLTPYYIKEYRHASYHSLTTVDILLISSFAFSSYKQFRCHLHLSKLVKYTLPDFKLVSCPHYLFEIIIYFVILIFSLKSGNFSTIQLEYLFSWFFVLVNLSTSALDSHNFYKMKYREKFITKWAVIPFLL